MLEKLLCKQSQRSQSHDITYGVRLYKAYYIDTTNDGWGQGKKQFLIPPHLHLIFSHGHAAPRDLLFCPASSPEFNSLCQKGRDFSSRVGKLKHKFFKTLISFSSNTLASS